MRAWLQASRPLAQVNIALPLLFGQALALAWTDRFKLETLLVAQVFGVLDQLFIVFTNDWADRGSDRRNRTYNRFSGGSRVLVEGKLTPSELGRGALSALLAIITLAGYLGVFHGQVVLLWLTLLGVLLVWAYSLPPLRLSYRGHGEVLQGLGVGVVLPLVGFYLQSGSLSAFPIWVLGPAFVLGYAGNITTALPDVPSDRETAKRTYAVRRGSYAARRDSLILLALAAVAPALGMAAEHPTARYAASALPLLCLVLNLFGLPSADAERHTACERFVLLNGTAIGLVWALWAVALCLPG